MKKIVFSSIGVLLLSSACAFVPIKLHTRFDAVGPIQNQKRKPIVASKEAVEIHYASSPEGFSLKENELKVESGYGHKIVGRLEVLLANDGGCMTNQRLKRPMVDMLTRGGERC